MITTVVIVGVIVTVNLTASVTITTTTLPPLSGGCLWMEEVLYFLFIYFFEEVL